MLVIRQIEFAFFKTMNATLMTEPTLTYTDVAMTAPR